MKSRFDTREAAYEAGYLPARAAYVGTHRGYEIRIVDISGPAPGGGEFFGYDFALMALADDERPSIGPYGKSVDIYLAQDSNKAADMGAFAPLFHPREFKEALREIWREIDSTSDDSEN